MASYHMISIVKQERKGRHRHEECCPLWHLSVAIIFLSLVVSRVSHSITLFVIRSTVLAMQQRGLHHRSRATAIPLGGAQLPNEFATASTGAIRKRRRRRKQRQSKDKEAARQRLVIVVWSCMLIAIYCFYARTKTSASNHGISFMEEHVRQYTPLYDEIRRVAAEVNRTNVDFRQSTWPDYGQYKQRPTTVLGPRYGSIVEESGGCNLTVLFLDPRIGDPQYGPGRSAWYSLESVAAFAPSSSTQANHTIATTCVLLLTSSCGMQAYLKETFDSGGSISFNAQEAVRDKVYSSSLPLFRNMIDRGVVRLSFLDEFVDKYKLSRCDDYGSLHFLMHANFWKDEFINGMDSDSVLLIQDDAVLCHGGLGPQGGGTSLLLSVYKNYAFVGGVWPRQADRLRPYPPEGMCQGMSARWKSWILPQRRWEKWRAKDGVKQPRCICCSPETQSLAGKQVSQRFVRMEMPPLVMGAYPCVAADGSFVLLKHAPTSSTRVSTHLRALGCHAKFWMMLMRIFILGSCSEALVHPFQVRLKHRCLPSK